MAQSTPTSQDFPVSNLGSGLKRKRLPRAPIACENCRKRKGKCDGDGRAPCTTCLRLEKECVFATRTLVHVGATPTTTATLFDRRDVGGNTAQATGSVDPRTGLRAGSITERPSLSISPSAIQECIPSYVEAPVYHVTANDHIEHPLATANTLSANEQSAHIPSPSSANTVGRQSDVGGFAGLNHHTKGIEFYGATGIFPFLARLRQWARSYRTPDHAQPPSAAKNVGVERRNEPSTPPPSDPLGDISILNYLHNPDYSNAESRPRSPLVSNGPSKNIEQQRPVGDSSLGVENTVASSNALLNQRPPNRNTNTLSPWNVARSLGVHRNVEMTCINLYFETLHHIHPILDMDDFLSRVEQDIWDGSISDRYSANKAFHAIYYAIMAIGAVVASEPGLATLSVISGRNVSKSEVTRTEARAGGSEHTQFKLAKFFFEQCKTFLGDVFEVCSLESTQALFLLSVFCQNALKPHSCYMYSGMAARTALAIGLPHETPQERDKLSTGHLQRASRTWWSVYAHEVEMCCASGRDISLKIPHHYSIPFPVSLDQIHESANDMFVTLMTSIADILMRASEEIYQQKATVSTADKALLSNNLDQALQKWKNDLPGLYAFEKSSLTEPESISKQKVVLRLKYHSARIFLHRPFVEDWTPGASFHTFKPEVRICLDASRRTITLLYETYMHQPYFRTWYYNTTYLLNAAMLVLYVVFTGAHDCQDEELLADVEKSLEIFHAMNMIIVARRCAKLTKEVLDVAKSVVLERQASCGNMTSSTPRMPVPSLDDRFLEATATVSDVANGNICTANTTGNRSSNNVREEPFTGRTTTHLGYDIMGNLPDLNFDFSDLIWDSTVLPGDGSSYLEEPWLQI